MTTDEMRAAALANFDAAAADLRDVVDSQTLTNPEYRALKDAIDNVQYAINRILRVNGVIKESEK